MKEDDKKKLQEHFMAMDEMLAALTQQKQSFLQEGKRMLADLPLEKINDDIFDVDSEVLKSEESHYNIRIEGLEFDLKALEVFRGFVVYLREVLETEGLIDRTTSSDDLKQYYDILESKETDSPEEIKAKFRELIKFYHPDYFQNNPEKMAFAEKKTKELNNAFDKLHEHGIL